MDKSTNKALNVNYHSIISYFRLNTMYIIEVQWISNVKDLHEWQAHTITYHSNYGIHTKNRTHTWSKLDLLLTEQTVQVTW